MNAGGERVSVMSSPARDIASASHLTAPSAWELLLGRSSWVGFLVIAAIACVSVFARLTGPRPLLWVALGLPLFAISVWFGPRLAAMASRWSDGREHGAVKLAVGLAALGALLRVAYVIAVPPVQSSDMQEYWGLALRLLREGEYYTGTEFGVRWYAYRPPGYSAFLAGAIAIFGEWKYLPAALAIGLYGAAQFVLFRMSRAWCGAAAATAAVGLFAIWPSQIAMTGLCFYEPLFTWLILLSLWWIARSRTGSAVWAAAGGVIAGLSILVRQSLLPLPLLLLAYRIFDRDKKRALLHVALTSACLAAVVLPWTMRNYSHGLPAVVATNSGQAFYLTANPDATADYYEEPGLRLFRELKYDEASIDKTAMERGKQWVRDNPWKWLKLVIDKQVIFLGEDTTGLYWSMRVPSGSTGPVYAVAQLLGHLWWILIWVLAVAGVAAHRERIAAHPELRLLIHMILLFVAAAAPFTIQPRYHVPFVPLVLLLAGLSVVPAYAKTRNA